jgi:hypothetical protein
MMISAAKRGRFEAPGIRDTRKIQVIMIMVERAVVATDKEYVAVSTALAIFNGIQTGHTSMAKYAMPVAESKCQKTLS